MNRHWNFATAEAAHMQTILDKILHPLTRVQNAAAIIQSDETPLLVEPQSPADVVTLTVSAATCRRYLKLKDRDVAILNDPSSGGTWLTHVTLVAGVAPRGGDAELLIVSRFAVNPPAWGTKGHLSEEGVQIPPMPIAQNGVVNTEILKAIGQHPAAAPDFAKRLEDEIARLLVCVDGAKRIFRSHAVQWPNLVKNYLEQSTRAFESAMARVPLGGMNVSATLSSGELVKLHLDVNEKFIQFDFKGSDGSSNVGLSEHVTFGVCISAILKWTATQLPINGGLISHFQLSAPSKSLLSTKAPLGVWRGANEALPVLSKLIESALVKLAKAPAPVVKKLSPRDLQLDLAKPGMTAAAFKINEVSVEASEKTWPFTISSVSKK